MDQRPDDAHPTALDALNAEHLADIVRDIGIPPRPSILVRLAEEMRRDDPDFNHMAQLVERDVSLSAGLLKTLNAASFGLQRKVRSVREGLLLMGLGRSSRLVAGLALRQVFPPGPSLERFWDASDMTAQLSGWLVHEMGVRHGIQHDDAYTYALFRDCGIPVMLKRFPGYHSALSEANESREQTFTEAEERSLPTNHAVVGAVMARTWALPEPLAGAILHHHRLAQSGNVASLLARDVRHLIAIAQIAEHLFQEASGLSRNHEWEKLGAATLATLDLHSDDLGPLKLRAKAFLDSLEPL